MTDTAETWTQRIAWTALVAIVVGGITWAGWITIEINKKIDAEYIENNGPYSRQEMKIHSEISDLKARDIVILSKLEGEFSNTVRANTEAIIQLKEQMKYNNMIWERVIKELESDTQKPNKN